MNHVPTIRWANSIDQPWLGIWPHRIGDVPAGSETPDQYLLVTIDDQPLVRVDAYPVAGECFAFQEATLWHQMLVIGWGERVYLIDVESDKVSNYLLGAYFGHLYVENDALLVASAEKLWRIEPDGLIAWTSVQVGLDGVLVDDVTDDVIRGQGEWDPPGGWRPFQISLKSGQSSKVE